MSAIFFKAAHQNYPNYLLLGVTVFICLIIYSPGLTGGFIFDDFANLSKLGDYNGVRNLETFLLFVTNGFAGPTGRPISLLSFLLNDTTWPTDSYPFKLTNLLLHCLTGIFLFFLCRLIFLSLKLEPKKAALAALIATSFWLLHPFFVSTVLYVVQRMAMLSAFFSIVGLWLYCKGRLMVTDGGILEQQNRKAYIFLSLTLGLCTILAILSKENGVLLPLLVACLELCVFRHPNSIAKPLNRSWTYAFLVFPSLLIVGYLFHAINPDTFIHPFGNRNFNLPERLFTETRIVTGYLYSLIFPKLSYPGLFYENIEVSKNLWQPITTLLCVLLVVSLISSALLSRKRFPFFSLAVLFFFAGHLLESTTLGLELYFEHRNYLPAIFLFMPAGFYFVNHENRLIKGLIIILLTICPIFTYQLSTLWGNNLALNLYWAKQNPTSSRAQIAAALALEGEKKQYAALELLRQAQTNVPNSLDLYWYWLKLKCLVQGVTPEEFDQVKRASGKIPFRIHQYNMLQATISSMLNPECKGLNSENALELLDILLTNPGLDADQRRLFQPHHVKGLVYASTKRPVDALAEYETVLKMTQNIEHGMVQVGILASNGFYQEALTHLNAVEAVLKTQPALKQGFLKTKLDFSNEITRIRSTLQNDIVKQSTRSEK
jgi:protein O-mannosyl-transferase